MPYFVALALGRMVFVGGSRGTSPSLDLTFPPTGLSENGKVEGKGRVGETTCLTPPLASASDTTLLWGPTVSGRRTGSSKKFSDTGAPLPWDWGVVDRL